MWSGLCKFMVQLNSDNEYKVDFFIYFLTFTLLTFHLLGVESFTVQSLIPVPNLRCCRSTKII